MYCALANAQYHFIKQWDYRYGGIKGDAITCFQLTNDGGFILGGFSNSEISGDKTQAPWSSGHDDFWFVKLDSTGHKQWDKRYGGDGGDYPQCITQTSDHGFIITGRTSGGVSGDISESSKGGSDFWIIKIDKYGNKQWDKTLGGNRSDQANSVIQTRDGGYLVGGWSESGISGDKSEPCWDTTTIFQPYSDCWIVKTDSVGHKQWDKRYGGTHIDGVFSLAQTSDDGYILSGSSLSDSSGDKSQNNWGGSGDGWLIKIDSVGAKQWDKRLGSDGPDGIGWTYQTADGGYVVGAQVGGLNGDNSTGKSGFWLIKIDSAGNKQWDKVYDGGGATLFSMNVTHDGGYLFSGENKYFTPGLDKTENNLSSYQTWVIKADSMGNKQWDKTIFTDGSSDGFSIQTKDGCYAVANTTAGQIAGYKSQASWDSSADYWIIKFCMEPFNAIDDRQQTQDTRQIQVWPNPFTTDLQIALIGEHPTGAGFTITNTIGQAIYHQTETNLATGYTKMLDLSYLPDGLYFVEVVVDGERIVRRVVKE